jgi:hypothetical protein
VRLVRGTLVATGGQFGPDAFGSAGLAAAPAAASELVDEEQAAALLGPPVRLTHPRETGCPVPYLDPDAVGGPAKGQRDDRHVPAEPSGCLFGPHGPHGVGRQFGDDDFGVTGETDQAMDAQGRTEDVTACSGCFRDRA